MENEYQEDEYENQEEDFEYPKSKISFTSDNNQKLEIENQIVVVKLYKIENQYFNNAQEGANALHMTYPAFTRKYRKQDVRVQIVEE